MRVCLLNAPTLKQIGIVGQIYPPLGILYLASYAKKYLDEKIEFFVIDGYKETNFNELEKKILNFYPDILAVSFTTQAASGAYKIINQVKSKNPEIFVVSGGPHSSVLSEEVLEQSKTDLVVVGEGEKIFLEILKAYKNNTIEKDKENIKGLVYYKDKKIVKNELMPLIENLDEIPFPERSLLDIKSYPGYHYKKRTKDTSYVSTRGCPFNCVYCSNPVWKLQKPWYRTRSPQNIADEIQFLIDTYGISEFYDQTDEFNGNLKWSKSVCDEFIKRGLDINWKAQMRADNFDDELAQKMVRSGAWLGFFGVETGNERTSKGVNKNIKIEQVINSLRIMKKNRMTAFALLMAFNVWEEEDKLCFENKEDTLNTIKFVQELVKEKLVDLISWSLTTPYPGSKLYEIALRHNLIDKSIIGKWDQFDSSANFVMKLPGVVSQDWIDIQKKGKILQIKLLFPSGTFNIRSLPIYIQKAFKLLKRFILKK